MTPIILFRKSLAEEGEFDVCREYFPNTVEIRSKVPPHSYVIPRYSCLPYYQELEKDLFNNNKSILINSYKQHKWIANFEWYEPLKEYTAESWTDDNFFSASQDKQYIVKGRTNSKKHQWNKLMFAENKRRALEISGELIQDGLIGEQGIIYRQYIPLKTYEYGLNYLPFTDEYRFFFYRDQILAHGYYWSIATNTDRKIIQEGIDFAQDLSVIVKDYVNFFVLDVAQKKDGGWILIEINDGSMSGLSECRANELYSSLKKVLT
jgi:hypothetical protein